MSTQPIDLIEELPILTEIIEPSSIADLPILTEIFKEEAPVTESVSISDVPDIHMTEPPPRHTLNAGEMQQLLQHLESHLETVFARKLNTQLEQLQKLAVDLAISELKAELPQLLHDALKNRL